MIIVKPIIIKEFKQYQVKLHAPLCEFFERNAFLKTW